MSSSPHEKRPSGDDDCSVGSEAMSSAELDLKHKDQDPTVSQISEGGGDPQGAKYILLLACLYLGSFSAGYDNSCIGTLTPVITNQYSSLGDLGWYQTAYLLTICAPVLVYGQLYSLYSMKMLYLASFAIFVVGSTLTAAAPTSVSFITGRAISGLGAAGINSGVNIIIARTTPLERRPTAFAIAGGIECTALAFGPLISGSIARYVTWRVCFYILIPIGVFVIAIVFFSMENIRQTDSAQLSNKQKLERIDWVGFATLLPMTLCLILALQWAGTQYPWANWRIILLFALIGVLLIIFVFVENRRKENSLVSLKMLRQRTIACASIITFCDFAALAILDYYLPLYFQVVRGASTLHSGLMCLPLALPMAIFGLLGGPITSYFGYPNVNLLFGNVLTIIGTALITTLQPDTSAGEWIPFLIIYGIGIGLAFQPPFIAVSTVCKESVLPMALVLLGFTQMLGGIVILSIVQNVFLSKLSHALATEIPGFSKAALLETGLLDLMSIVPAEHRDKAIAAFNATVTDVIYVALGLGCLALICSFGIEWNSVKKPTSSEIESVNV